MAASVHLARAAVADRALRSGARACAARPADAGRRRRLRLTTGDGTERAVGGRPLCRPHGLPRIRAGPPPLRGAAERAGARATAVVGVGRRRWLGPAAAGSAN